MQLKRQSFTVLIFFLLSMYKNDKRYEKQKNKKRVEHYSWQFSQTNSLRSPTSVVFIVVQDFALLPPTCG